MRAYLKHLTKTTIPKPVYLQYTIQVVFVVVMSVGYHISIQVYLFPHKNEKGGENSVSSLQAFCFVFLVDCCLYLQRQRLQRRRWRPSFAAELRLKELTGIGRWDLNCYPVAARDL